MSIHSISNLNFMKTQVLKFNCAVKSLLFFQVGGLIIILFMLQGCFGTVYVPASTEVRTEPAPPPPPPVWAPAYDDVQHVRYYYVPDLEIYYDVWNREYVYLDNGHWVFTAFLPHAYDIYDINNEFVVVLDYKVYEPWRKHQLYISHYPRYYYQSAYNKTTVYNNTTIINNYSDNSNERSMRGYNENARTVIYTNSRRSATPVNTQQQPTRRMQSNEPERANTYQNNNTPNEPARRTENTRTSTTEVNTNQGTNNSSGEIETGTGCRTQPAVYTGKEIGKPVKVARSMRQPKASTKKAETEQKDTGKNDNSKPSRRR